MLKKMVCELKSLTNRVFNLPIKFVNVQNEKIRLERELEITIARNERLIKSIRSIGYDLSRISIFIENRIIDEWQDDVRDFESLGKNLNDLLRCVDTSSPAFDRTIEHIEDIEKALYQLVRNFPDKDYSLIKNVIRNTSELVLQETKL